MERNHPLSRGILLYTLAVSFFLSLLTTTLLEYSLAESNALQIGHAWSGTTISGEGYLASAFSTYYLFSFIVSLAFRVSADILIPFLQFFLNFIGLVSLFIICYNFLAGLRIRSTSVLCLSILLTFLFSSYSIIIPLIAYDETLALELMIAHANWILPFQCGVVDNQVIGYTFSEQQFTTLFWASIAFFLGS